MSKWWAPIWSYDTGGGCMTPAVHGRCMVGPVMREAKQRPMGLCLAGGEPLPSLSPGRLQPLEASPARMMEDGK